MSKKHAIMYFVVAMVFAAWSVMATNPAFSAPKVATVEVKAGTIKGLVTDLNEKPLQGKAIKILDVADKVKYSAITGKDGKYTITGIESGTYTMIIANSQKVTLLVKPDASNEIINVMLPAGTRPYSAGADDDKGISTPLVAGIVGGVVLIGVTTYGIMEWDSDEHGKVSP